VARSNRSAGPADLLRSLAVILVPLVIITALFTDLPDEKPVQEVDWKPILAVAREQSPYPVLAPTNLPAGWRATRATWVEAGDPHLNGEPSVRNLWQLGFLTPGNTYISLGQGDEQIEDFVAEQTRQGTVDGESTVGGQRWQRQVSPDGRTRSLVRQEPQATAVVSGDVDYAALEAYASTLSSTG
jgi:hypothetical protein